MAIALIVIKKMWMKTQMTSYDPILIMKKKPKTERREDTGLKTLD